MSAQRANEHTGLLWAVKQGLKIFHLFLADLFVQRFKGVDILFCFVETLSFVTQAGLELDLSEDGLGL